MPKLQNLLNLCYVNRWVIAPMYRHQSVAEHSYRVMVLTRMLHYYLEEPWEGLDRSIMYALDHDEEEAISGDMPGTYKDYNLGVPWPNPAMLKRWEIPVRVADAMETYDWWKNWGNHCWMHQRSPEQGCDNRDIRKIVHYTQGWPELLEAVRQTMQISLGYTDFYVKGMLG